MFRKKFVYLYPNLSKSTFNALSAESLKVRKLSSIILSEETEFNCARLSSPLFISFAMPGTLIEIKESRVMYVSEPSSVVTFERIESNLRNLSNS